MEKLLVDAQVWVDPRFRWIKEGYNSWTNIIPGTIRLPGMETSLCIRDFRKDTDKMVAHTNQHLMQCANTRHYQRALAEARMDMAATISQPASVCAWISEIERDSCLCSVDLLPPRMERNPDVLFSLTIWCRFQNQMNFLIAKESPRWCWHAVDLYYQKRRCHDNSMPDTVLVLLTLTDKQNTVTIENLQRNEQRLTCISDKVVEKTKLLTY